MKKNVILIILCLNTVIGIRAAGPNQKFMREAAKIVWNTKLEQFNPKAQLDDSIFDNASAAYIAIHEDVTANMKSSPFSQPSRGIYIGESTFIHYTRKMVKINDASAIENFAEFSFSPLVKYEATAGFSQYETEEAFGARIYKPDGSVVDIDMNNTLVETSGKKGKTIENYKIAIPGLEVGDVLEYFLYNRTMFLGNQSIGMTIGVMEEYPISDYSFNGVFNPDFTVELTSNNFEIPNQYTYDSDGNFLYELGIVNISDFDAPRWFSVGRQMPFISLYVSDNKSMLFDRPASARVSGLYVNLVAPVIMQEIAEYYAEDIRLPMSAVGKVNSLVKNYLKVHTEATDREIADAAWLACLYFTLSDKENSYNEWQFIALFKDVMDKQKIQTPVRLAVSSPRTGVDVERLGGRHRATPLVLVGEVPYILDKNMSMAPGEISGTYFNEKMFTFDGSREEVFRLNKINLERLPKSSARHNSDIRDLTVTIPDDPTTEEVTFRYTSTMSGAMKSAMGEIVNIPDYLNAIAEYLDIPDKKRSDRKFDTVALDAENREILEKMPSMEFDIETHSVDSVGMISFGFLPGDNKMSYFVSGTIDGLLSSAGDDIIFNVGRLGGKFSDLKDMKEKRDIDIITDSPKLTRTNITVNVPDGYYIEESELASLNINVGNSCGQFFTQANLSPDGNLILQVQLRNPATIYSFNEWGDFLAVHRAAAEFSGLSIVLHKK